MIPDQELAADYESPAKLVQKPSFAHLGATSQDGEPRRRDARLQMREIGLSAEERATVIWEPMSAAHAVGTLLWFAIGSLDALIVNTSSVHLNQATIPHECSRCPAFPNP